MMHKKVYNDFARMIRSQRHEIKYKMDTAQSEGEKLFLTGCAKMVCIMIDELVTMFQSDNPQFNPDKFIKACEINVES